MFEPVEPLVTNVLFIVLMVWLLATPYVFLAYYHYAVRPDLEQKNGTEVRTE